VCEQVCDGKYRKDYGTVGKAYSMASIEFSGDHYYLKYVNRPTFHEGERKRTIIPFLFPVILTFELLNYLLPHLLLYRYYLQQMWIWSFYSSPISKNLMNSTAVVLSL